MDILPPTHTHSQHIPAFSYAVGIGDGLIKIAHFLGIVRFGWLLWGLYGTNVSNARWS